MVNGPKLLSGRVPVTSYSDLSNDRYQFLGLSEAEPNLGYGNANSVLTLSTGNTRVWSNSITISSLNVTGNANLGYVGNVKITGGSSGQVLVTDGTGNLSWSGSPSNITEIQHGNSNVNIPDVDVNIYISANGSTNWTFATNGNFTTPSGIVLANTGNITNANVISANYLVSTLGCVSIGTGSIVVNNSTNNAGIFTTTIENLSIGIAANITLGSASGNVTVQNNLVANGNITTNNTVTANSIAVGDLYSKRAPINVGTGTIVDEFPSSSYRSAKYTIKVSDNTGYQAIEVLLVHDSINSIITVYGSLSTTGLELVSLASEITGGNVQLLATGFNTGTSLNLMGTYVPD